MPWEDVGGEHETFWICSTEENIGISKVKSPCQHSQMEIDWAKHKGSSKSCW